MTDEKRELVPYTPHLRHGFKKCLHGVYISERCEICEEPEDVDGKVRVIAKEAAAKAADELVQCYYVESKDEKMAAEVIEEEIRVAMINFLGGYPTGKEDGC